MAREDKAAGSNGVDRGLAATVSRLADGVGNLVAQHLQLARLEVAADAKAVGGELARLVIYVPFVVIGYAFLCGAIAVGLMRLMPTEAALGLVGGANLAGGAWGLWAAARRLKGQKVLASSLDEVGRSAALFAPRGPSPDKQLESSNG